MEKGLLYFIILLVVVLTVFAGSIKKGFQPARFLLSLAAIFFIPGLAVSFGRGILLLVRDTDTRLPLLSGLISGLIIYEILLRRLRGFATFEHELTHALAALVFFRKIKKFVVTREQGGYIECSQGFGGKTGDYFITLAPYYLPTFTFLSVLIRPFLSPQWFPGYDAWIGLTFSYQMMSNIEELKQNWTKKKFRPANASKHDFTDIGHEGYIFSFIMILSLKLFFTGMVLYIISGGFSALPGWMGSILKYSAAFYFSFFTETGSFLF